MIKFEHTEVLGWEHAIRGMRNPMNSWEKSDSWFRGEDGLYNLIGDLWDGGAPDHDWSMYAGENDHDLMMRLAKGGPVHAKYRRMITVYVDITGPLYWWKEMDTYQVGVVKNSCSTMHKIAEKKFTLEDFSCEHLERLPGYIGKYDSPYNYPSVMDHAITALNEARKMYLETKDKKYWWQMIQLLPSSYNQRRTVMLNYEVLANIYKSRRNHKLDEWCEHKNIDIETLKRYYAGTFKLRDEKSLADIGFCDWIKTLPYSELIVGERSDGTGKEE